MEERNDIDNLFREGLGDYTESPPPAAWDAMEKRLAQPGKKRPYGWLLLAMLSSALVIGVLVTQKPATGTAANETAAVNSASTDKATAAAPSTTNTPTKGKATTVASAGTESATPATHAINTSVPVANNTSTQPVQAENNPVVAGNSNRRRHTAHVIKVGADNNAAPAMQDKATTPTGTTGNNAAAVAKTSTHKAINTQPTTTANTSVVIAANNVTTTKAGTLNSNNNTPAAALTVLSSATTVAATTNNKSNKKHSKQNTTAVTSVAATNTEAKKQTGAGTNNTVAATSAAKPANNQTAVVASKQNNIQVVSEVPADVLAAAEQQKAEAAKQALNKATATTATPANTSVATNKGPAAPPTAAPQKLVMNEQVRPVKAKNAFTETVSFIQMGAPAANGGGMDAGAANAGKTRVPRWEAGLKAGYESGTKGLIASKYDFAPFLKYNISKKAAILVQPGMKLVSIKNTMIDAPKNYYKNSGSFADTQSVPIPSLNMTTYTYNYFESGDSFKVGHSIAQRNYMQFELPIMFSYQATKNLSILAGISMVYSKLVSVAQDSVNAGVYNLRGSVSYTVPTGYTPPNAPGINSAIQHTASPYLTLANPAYQVVGGDVFSIGYLFGFSYTLSKHFMFDAMMQQSLTGFGNIKNADIKSLYTQPYIRFTIGYSLWKQK